MISLVDCVALSGLSEEEIRAIAEHEHVSEAVACGLAQYLSQAKSGEGRMRDMIIDDIRSFCGVGAATRMTTSNSLFYKFKANSSSDPAIDVGLRQPSSSLVARPCISACKKTRSGRRPE